MSHVVETPTVRKLRGYAFDPSLSLLLDTVDVNHIVYRVRWEPLAGKGRPTGGIIGEYVEIVDYDPTVGVYYTPADLNDPFVLAEDGLAPSESDPAFHQQMVYAVAMLTIQNFERALGRKILWSTRLVDTDEYEVYVPRLRLYPHALREPNAYYSPLKKSVLFGYFAASPANRTLQMPGALVFTCLSHDIIAHEVTHAILDGLHRRYNRPTNPDVLAFHEAFADIVALFQHFSFPEVLKHQIARTRGDLERQNLLGQLAKEFGTAIGHYGSLRDAIGETDPKTGEWKPRKPDPAAYLTTNEPHARGSILVAAVFDAFLSIYKRRVQDLLRIATNGTGRLPEGELHPDLVNRLADEASRTAEHILGMCIRAIDYCPPVDITFGDYLRAIITADHDVVDDDRHHYRLAFVDAFRRRGIYPENIRTLSVESLCHPTPELEHGTRRLMSIISRFLREYRNHAMYDTDREAIYDRSREYIAGRRRGLHERLWIKFDDSPEFERLTGLVFNHQWRDFGVRDAGDGRGPSYQIQNLRIVSRVGPDGKQVNQIVFALVQRARVVPDGDSFRPLRHGEKRSDAFEVEGGSTLIFDLNTASLRYAISKPLLDARSLTGSDYPQRRLDVGRIARQYRYEQEDLPLAVSDVTHHFASDFESGLGEPFALLHRRVGSPED